MTSLLTTRPEEATADHDPRWTAIVDRDRRADGTFYYSVRTTGVYCRPSCGSRLANPANVRFHETRADAEAAGFRPCRRCRPDQASDEARRVQVVAEACRLIESADETPSLAVIASHVGLSAHHFHRLLTAVTGVTPRDYASSHRAARLRTALTSSRSMTDAIHEAGYSSTGRFYETSEQHLGMTPAQFRAGGADMAIHFAVGDCSLGSVLVAQSAKGVCAILLGDNPEELIHDLEGRFPRATLIGGGRSFDATVARVVGFIDRPAEAFELPLDVRGTIFQQRVWRALRDIPPGHTVTYAELATRIGAPRSARAVARACASNPIAVAIPCHRVVRRDGNPGGYRWGIHRKRRLLDTERNTRTD